MKLAVKNAWKTRERKTVVSFRQDLDTAYKVKENKDSENCSRNGILPEQIIFINDLRVTIAATQDGALKSWQNKNGNRHYKTEYCLTLGVGI